MNGAIVREAAAAGHPGAGERHDHPAHQGAGKGADTHDQHRGKEAALRRVDRDELVRLTQDLVRIDSVIRPETGGTERDVVAYLADWIRRELAVEPLIEEVAPGRQNIIATLDSGGPGPCLMLEGPHGRGERGRPRELDARPVRRRDRRTGGSTAAAPAT